MTNLDSVLESRDITLLIKVCMVKAMVFPVVTYSCESWTIEKAEHRRTDAFELWCWRRLLQVPWTARPNQSILREINPAYSLEELMLKLKLPVFWASDLNIWLNGKVPDAGKDWGQKKRSSEDEMVGRHHRCNGHELQQTLEMVRDTERPGMLQSMGSQRVRNDWVTEQQQMKYPNVPSWYIYFQVISKKTTMVFKMLPHCHLQKQKFQPNANIYNNMSEIRPSAKHYLYSLVVHWKLGIDKFLLGFLFYYNNHWRTI